MLLKKSRDLSWKDSEPVKSLITLQKESRQRRRECLLRDTMHLYDWAPIFVELVLFQHMFTHIFLGHTIKCYKRDKKTASGRIFSNR
jgi:hypothetical protein